MKDKNTIVATLFLFIRFLLVSSICSAVILSILLFIVDKNLLFLYSLEWFAIMSTAVIVYFSIFVLLVFTIYNVVKKEKVWNNTKKEAILIVLTILSWTIFGLINNYILL